MKIADAKPAVSYYHYSNRESQGALICQTEGFPHKMPAGMEYSSAYSDRIAGWDHDRFTQACEIAEAGEQGWAYKLPTLPVETLRRFAQIALNLPTLPDHVRIVHWYNVSSGYSVPTVEAIYDPAKDATGDRKVTQELTPNKRYPANKYPSIWGW